MGTELYDPKNPTRVPEEMKNEGTTEGVIRIHYFSDDTGMVMILTRSTTCTKFIQTGRNGNVEGYMILEAANERVKRSEAEV